MDLIASLAAIVAIIGLQNIYSNYCYRRTTLFFLIANMSFQVTARVVVCINCMRCTVRALPACSPPPHRASLVYNTYVKDVREKIYKLQLQIKMYYAEAREYKMSTRICSWYLRQLK